MSYRVVVHRPPACCIHQCKWSNKHTSSSPPCPGARCHCSLRCAPPAARAAAAGVAGTAGRGRRGSRAAAATPPPGSASRQGREAGGWGEHREGPRACCMEAGMPCMLRCQPPRQSGPVSLTPGPACACSCTPPPPPPPPPQWQHVSAAYGCRTSEARLHHMCHRLVKDGEKGQLLVFAAAGKATGVGVAGYSSSSVVGG